MPPSTRSRRAAFAQNFAAGGSLADNSISGSLDAHISGRQATPAVRAVVDASDHSRISAVAGEVAFTFSGGAWVGTALSTNEITRDTVASIDGSDTNASATALEVLAMSDAQIEGIAARGDGAQNLCRGRIADHEHDRRLAECAPCLACRDLASKTVTVGANDSSLIILARLARRLS